MIKKPQKAVGFMLLEVIALVGFVLLIGSATTVLHGLIMNSYRETHNRMQALLYAENLLARELTGVPYTFSDTNFTSKKRETKIASFVSPEKPCTLMTVSVYWSEKGVEKEIKLSRLVAEGWMLS